MSMLEVKDLQVYYGVIQALKGISFHVEQGEVIALIGANGAGKTTTLQTLTGIIPAKAGSISFGGKDLQRHLHIRLLRWVWRMFRKEDVSLQICLYTKTF